MVAVVVATKSNKEAKDKPLQLWIQCGSCTYYGETPTSLINFQKAWPVPVGAPSLDSARSSAAHQVLVLAAILYCLSLAETGRRGLSRLTGSARK